MAKAQMVVSRGMPGLVPKFMQRDRNLREKEEEEESFKKR